MNLPDPIDINEADFPELLHIFREIDLGIAAIIASDPTLSRKSTTRRRKPAPGRTPRSRPPSRTGRNAAA